MPHSHCSMTRLLAIALAMTFVLSACQGTHSPTGQSSNKTKDPTDRFPQTVGTSWQYAAEDISLHLTDTITIQIDRLVESTDTSRTWLWTFESLRGEIVWPNFHVTITGNRVKLKPLVEYQPWGLFNPLGRSVWLTFPLGVDSNWHYGGYQSIVSDADTLSVPLGTFAALHVSSYWITPCLSCWQSFEHWYVADVGFVRMARLEGVNGPGSHQIWELIDWDPEE